MAESAPVEAAKQITKAPVALWDFVKKYWWAGPALLLGLVAVGMAIKPWFTRTMTSSTTAAPGDKLPTFLRTFLRISAFVAPFVLVTLSSDLVLAATQCCADQLHVVASQGGFLDAVKEWIVGIGGGGGVMLGATLGHLSAPDTLDGKTQDGGTNLAYVPGGADTKSMFLRTATKNRAQGGRGVGLYAVDTKIAIDTSIEQVPLGTNPIDDQDLARLVDYIEISTPFHGPILSSETGTGPILNHLIDFIGQGFSRAGDAPVETITVPAVPTVTAVTKYFTMPWAQRWLSDPSDTTPWLLSLDNMRVDVRVASSTALAAVSALANTQGASRVRMWTSYNPDPVAKPRYLPYWRLDRPASGSDGLTFQTFGGAGPTATKKVDKVHTIGWLSNLKGLPGNLTFDTLTRIVAPSFGLDDVRNIDGLVLERLNSQTVGRVGDESYATGGNHAEGTIANNGGAALNALLFLLLRQPALNMVPGLLMPMDSSKRLNLTVDLSVPRLGPDAFLVGSLRELNSDALQREFSASGGRTPMSYGQAKLWRVEA